MRILKNEVVAMSPFARAKTGNSNLTLWACFTKLPRPRLPSMWSSWHFDGMFWNACYSRANFFRRLLFSCRARMEPFLITVFSFSVVFMSNHRMWVLKYRGNVLWVVALVTRTGYVFWNALFYVVPMVETQMSTRVLHTKTFFIQRIFEY